MCGIFGYIGSKPASPILIAGLKRLEYRGYDSAGICLLENSELLSCKSSGKIANLESKVLSEKLSQATLGIGHTRWATHGEPTEVNAHPHFDCKKEIAVVHNGIIENYQALKSLLEKEGHNFVSQTDTEVIAHLIEKFYPNEENLEKAVLKTVEVLEGTFGLAVICKKEQKIIAVKKGSPLVLGIGDKEMFLASDASPLISYTKRVIYLEDNEMAILSIDGFAVKKFDGSIIEKEIQEIKWSVEEIEKGGFEHFMLKEIFEQPQAIENTLRGRLNANGVKLAFNLDPSSIKRIIILACGTSYYSGLIGKYIIERIVGIPVEVDYASEFKYRNPLVCESDLAVVISQSGETADTLGALKIAKAKGAKTIGIVNVVGSTIAREVDEGIYLHAGPEIGVAATKAFTCQITALILLSIYLQQNRGDCFMDLNFLEQLRALPSQAQEVLGQSEKIKNIAQIIKTSTNALFLGRGTNYPVALEGALKLKECSYIHAEGYPAAEMKHGPIALIDENMPVIFLATKDETYEKILSNMQEVKARKGKIFAIVNYGDELARKLADEVIEVPSASDLLSPIINVIPLQLLAYYVAIAKGINVDRPRNLAKSVTVE
ncbi:MAG: glutamine--fructose-6-phosphate transaminase (isomerizing) [Candidatus Staskawiczbacteria bacterium]|nr:glutamine--fructose-6-phosphate transaminase (isomerizing) [Candidatus Staskawiczbacteria bacterium]